MENGIFLLLGSNLGNPANNLEYAREKLATAIGSVLLTSSIYKTAPWGITNQPPFLNQVIVTEATMDPYRILSAIGRIEQDLGRVREIKWGPRPIDIDILFYDNEVIHDSLLDIPHPGIPFRRFVLEPLAEIAPGFMHPEIRKSVIMLLSECDDTSTVERLPSQTS